MHDIDNMTDEEFIEFVEDLESEEELMESDEEENVPERSGSSETDTLDGDTSKEDAVRETGDAEYQRGILDGRNARLISHIKKLYPDLSEEAAVDMFLEDADREAAEAEGLSLEDYRNVERERKDFADFKAERERKRQDEEALNSIVEKWKVDTERMKTILPGFDFEKAMEQSQFRDKVIKEGKDIISAYFELNPINKAPATAVRRDIEVADMPGGVSGGFKSPFDIERASEEEFKRYVKERLDTE